MTFAKNLRCKECGIDYPLEKRTACDECFGAVGVIYDYKAACKTFTAAEINKR